MCKRLLDKNAIVTGAGRGMGYAIARALYDEGARVAIIDIDDKGVAEAAHRLDSSGRRVIGRKADVTDKGGVRGLIQEVKSLWGGVDILVNNAGGALNTPYLLEEIAEKDWDLVVDVNLKGSFICSQAVIPEMVETGRRGHRQYLGSGRTLESFTGRSSVHGSQGGCGGFDPATGV